ncbi:MAG: XRE family transcriptional regulator [Sneathiellaceae bacterium]
MDKRTLKEIRKARRRTQVELAAKLEINQSNVARAEQAHDARISDLAAYIEALGGQLDLVARFPGEAPVLIEGLSNDKPLKR